MLLLGRQLIHSILYQKSHRAALSSVVLWAMGQMRGSCLLECGVARLQPSASKGTSTHYYATVTTKHSTRREATSPELENHCPHSHTLLPLAPPYLASAPGGGDKGSFQAPLGLCSLVAELHSPAR